MSGTVVVGLDGSKASKAALRWAADQAELTGASLTAVNSWGPIYPVGVDPEEHARKTLVKALEEVVGHDRAATVRLVLSPDAPGHLLVHESAQADVLVVGGDGHGHAGLPGVLLGSVTEYCVRHAKCPVAVIRTAARP